MDAIDKRKKLPIPTMTIIAEGKEVLERLGTDKIAEGFGTYFIFDIAPEVSIHKGDTPKNETARELIGSALIARYRSIISQVQPDAEATMSITSLLTAKIAWTDLRKDSNGEIILSMRNMMMDLKLLFPLTQELILSLNRAPLEIEISPELYEIPFCGFGFRFISPRSV